MQVNIGECGIYPHVVHRVIPIVWITLCIVPSDTPKMWITYFSIHTEKSVRVAM